MFAKEITDTERRQNSMITRLKDYSLLMKLRLTWLVVFSAVVSYLMGAKNPDWTTGLMLTLGGFLVTGSSNAFNQIIEKDLDKMMSRTENRPMPKERLKQLEALVFSSVCGLVGVAILWVYTNPLCGMLGLAALLSYVAIYTPLKRKTPFAVFVGAFPGAIPPLLGWVAATGELDKGLILFAIQFIWQFPHFWSIAWVLDEDYKKAGFFMLPAADGRSKTSALQILIYTTGIIPIGLLPYMFNMAGIVSAVIVTLTGIYFMLKAVKLLNTCEVTDARKLMFASFVYLPIVQLALMFDKL